MPLCRFYTDAVYFAAITSISTSAFFGKPFTAIAERAGHSLVKYREYTSFMSANMDISCMKTVVFITLSRK